MEMLASEDVVDKRTTKIVIISAIKLLAKFRFITVRTGFMINSRPSSLPYE
jgi:hypothetical protein